MAKASMARTAIGNEKVVRREAMARPIPLTPRRHPTAEGVRMPVRVMGSFLVKCGTSGMWGHKRSQCWAKGG
eukprot:6100064-Amphidinium_carterae.1